MIKEKGMDLTVEDRLYMQEALALAQKAFDMGEVPVGCVVVRRGENLVCYRQKGTLLS